MNKYLGITLAAVIGGIIVLVGASQLGWGETRYVRPAEEPVVQFSNLTDPADRTDVVPASGFTIAADRALPAVVHIKSASRVSSSRGQNGGRIPDMFRDFFGPGFDDQLGEPGQGPLQEGSGSGVIISPDGYIVTNNHVVEGAETLEVVLNDQSTYEAEVIGTDETTDVALIKIDGEQLPTIKFADSDEVKVGEWVVAVGNPFSLTNTVTAGIVSAKGRSIDILRRRSQYAIESFIQTDAVVNPGNSGGALVNINGDLVGINTAISSPTGVFAGYSFAVPSKIVAKVVEDLREFGSVQRGYLGASIVELNSDLASERGIDRDNGVLISGVNDGSAADEAGLREGDVVIAIDDVSTLRNSELLEQLGRRRPGDAVRLTIVRGGDEMDITATLKAATGQPQTAELAGIEDLGIELGPVDRELAAELEINSGLQIERIGSGAIQDQTRIQEGFIITSIDGESIDSVDELENIVNDDDRKMIMIEGVYPSGKPSRFAVVLR
ncbi:MAG: Do family serine endopeptidase [Bacteroidota bacterium]